MRRSFWHLQRACADEEKQTRPVVSSDKTLLVYNLLVLLTPQTLPRLWPLFTIIYNSANFLEAHSLVHKGSWANSVTTLLPRKLLGVPFITSIFWEKYCVTSAFWSTSSPGCDIAMSENSIFEPLARTLSMKAFSVSKRR